MTPSDSTASAARHRLIRSHIERLIGRVAEEFADSDPASGVKVLRVEPDDARPLHTLITVGLSDCRMTAPSSTPADAPRHIELMMTLPRHWKVDRASMGRPQYRWPVTELFRLAQLVRGRDQWLGWGTAMAHGDPPDAYVAESALCAVILAPSLLVKQDFYELHAADRRIVFFAAIPLYREEFELQQRVGMQQLLSKLIDHNVKDIVDLRRRNVAKKRFGLF